MFTKFISKNIQEKLKSKERALGWKNLNSSQPTKPEGSVVNTLRPKDIMSRTTFVRMCSNKEEVDNIVISGGELGEDGLLKFGTDLYASRATDGGGNQFRPIGGVKDISVEYKGGFKAIRQCTVNWMVNSLGDLQKLTPYFLSVGKTVIVDWGWVNSNSVNFEVPPFITKSAEGKFEVNQSIFANPQEKILDMKGDYDAIGGYVSNFSYDLRPDGGFDCVTTIIALGANLFDLPLDKGHNAAGSLMLNSQEDSKVYVPPDNLVNATINLKRIIYHDIFGLEWISDYALKSQDVFADRQTLIGGEGVETLKDKTGFGRKEIEYFALFGEDGANAVRSKIGRVAAGFKDVFPNNGKGLEDYKAFTIHQGKMSSFRGCDAVFIDNQESPNVMIQTDYNFKIDYFVTWAWFEDQFINRYISFMAGEDDAAKLTFRSLDTVLHNPKTDPNRIGEPISTEYLKTQIDAVTSLNQFSIKKQFFAKQGIYLDADIDSTNFNDILKVPTLIRNPPFLHPIDPNKFFIKETLPTEVISDYGEDKIWNSKDRMKVKSARATNAKRKLKSYEAIASNDNIRPFSYEGDTDDVKPKGALRNIWINIKEIQKAFGVSAADAPIQDEGNVSPPGTLENGVKRLLNQMNQNFNSVWNFDIVTDPFDSTNIKIIDKKTSNVNKPIYTEFKENSHAIQTQGIYKFPAFNVGSIVKSQNLAFKIPNAMAVSALYASNKNKGMTNESEYNGSEISKLFRTDEIVEGSDPFKDKYLKSLTKSFQSGDHNIDNNVPFTATTVGSEYSSYNSKIVKGNTKGSFNVLKTLWDRNWWKRWVSGNKSSEEATSTVTTKEEPPKERLRLVNVTEENGNVVQKMIWEIETDKNNKSKAGTNVYGENDSRKGGYYNYDEKLNKFVLLDEAKYALRSYLNDSGGRGKFSSDDIIPAELTLEIDGTGGIMPGDVIQTDYIQPKYNLEIYKDAINLGPQVYFQIFNLNQKVDSAGWTTEINTKMRYNSIPNEKGLTLEKVKTKPIEALTTTPKPPAKPPEQPGVIGPDSAFSGFTLNNTFTLPPLEAFKPSADPEDYVEPLPEKEELPIEEPAEEAFVPPIVINNGIPPEDEGIDTPVPEPAQEIEVEVPEKEMEIIRVVKGSPGQPRIPMPVIVKTVKAPQTAVEEVTIVEYTKPEVGYAEVPPPPPKPKPPATPPPPTPPKIVETPVQKVKREQKQKAPKRKSNPAPRKTTYRKTGAQNRLIYRVIPLWRPEWSSTQKQRDNGEYKQEVFYGENSGKTPVPWEVRQKFWDDNIEPPNSTGESNNSIVSANEASLLNSGRYFSSTYIAKYDNR